MYHAYAAQQWGEGVLRRIRIDGEGLLVARFLRNLRRGCPRLLPVDKAPDMRLQLSASDNSFLSLSCYRVADNTLLFSRSYIWTASSSRAMDGLLLNFIRALCRELAVRFPAAGGQ